MDLICPNCGIQIPPTNVNVSENSAECKSCNYNFKANSLFKEEEEDYPPVGSKINLINNSEGLTKLFYPRKGVTIPDFLFLIVIIFWFSFNFLWSLAMFQLTIVHAFLNLPFWIVGLIMVKELINSVNGTQTLEVNTNQLKLLKNRPINQKHFYFDLQEIKAIKVMYIRRDPFTPFRNFRLYWKLKSNSIGKIVEVPAIVTKSKTEFFFENSNEAEKEWIVNYLNKKLWNTGFSQLKPVIE